jgi:hypothetical protein
VAIASRQMPARLKIMRQDRNASDADLKDQIGGLDG